MEAAQAKIDAMKSKDENCRFREVAINRDIARSAEDTTELEEHVVNQRDVEDMLQT